MPTATATRPVLTNRSRPTLVDQLGYPSTMVRDPRTRARLLELEQTPGAIRRRLVDLAIEDREDELAGYADEADQLVSLLDLRLDDELLNGLLLIRELLP